MKKAGKLQRLADLKEFWELMLGPPSPPPSHPPSHSAQPMTRHAMHRLHTFSEEEEEDEDFTSWALTTLPPEKKRVSINWWTLTISSVEHSVIYNPQKFYKKS